MKRIGFLSFWHYQDVPGSVVRTAQDALLQTIDLAVAAEELGIDGAYVRVHHFTTQLASPFPLLSAMAASTSRIEVGVGESQHLARSGRPGSELLRTPRTGGRRGSGRSPVRGLARFG